jgi:hypothetical protein
MRHTRRFTNWVETGLGFRLFRRTRSVLLWQLGVALVATNAYGQTIIMPSPQELLATDPAAFARWLETDRPRPVSAQDKARILRTLPPKGEVTNLDAPARRKLAALSHLLRATGREAVYEIKVVDVPVARVGLYARTVVLISEKALTLLEAEGLQALVAHELGHEYIWAEHEGASELRDHKRLKQLELICDAIAIVTLQEIGLNPSRLMRSVERITRYNRKHFGPTVDESGYPTLSERWASARAVTAWVARPSSPRASARDKK